MTTLTQALKSHSSQTHDNIDHLVMSKKPFDTQDNYRKFLQAQELFHQAVTPVYQNAMLLGQFDKLDEYSRLDKVKADMTDLGISSFDSQVMPPDAEHLKNSLEAIGWFYCAEGSNVGAAILYKEAGKIELNDEFGAKHLSAHPDGRMPHWRATKEKIDALALDEQGLSAVLKGCDDAFAYFGKVLQEVFGDQ